MSGIIAASNNIVVRARVYDDKLQNGYGYNSGHLFGGLGISIRNPLDQAARSGSEDIVGADNTFGGGTLHGNLDNPTFKCADGNRRTITALNRLTSIFGNRFIITIAHDVAPSGSSLTASEVGTTISTPHASLNFSDASVILIACSDSSWNNFNNAATCFQWTLPTPVGDNAADPLNTPSDVYTQNDASQANTPFADMRAFDNLIQVTIS